MFIKLTRKYNGGHVWINADCIIAVETGQKGGSVVVPAGDDIDYDVVEDPETVISLLGEETKSFPPRPGKKLGKISIRRRDDGARGRLRIKTVESSGTQKKDSSENEKVPVQSP